MGQRILSSILFLALLVIGALLGQQAGTFPALAAGQTITPDYISGLIGQITAAALLLFGVVRGLFLAINARVVAGTLNPKDLTALFTLPEFWTALIGVIVTAVQWFAKVTILAPEQQAVLVNSILGIMTVLLNSLGARPNKAALPTQMVIEGQAARVPLRQ